MKRKAKDKIGVLLLRILIFVALPLLDCAGAGTLVRESPIPIEELQPNTLLICADNKLRTTDSDLECAATTKHWASRAGIRIFLISEVKIPDLPLADVGAPENRRVIFGRGIEYVLIISPNRMGWVVYSPNGDTEYGIGLRTEWVRRWPLETCQIVVDAQKTDLDSGGIALDLSNRGIHEFDIRGECSSIQYLNLSGNHLQHVDASVWNLPALKILNLDSNQLESIKIPTTAKLQRLSASNNRLAQLTFDPGSKVSELILRNNELSGIDEEMVRGEPMFLDVSSNRIREVTLSSDNQSLETLYITNNDLESCDDLNRLRALRSLVAVRNHLAGCQIPDSLRILDLSFNRIDSFSRIRPGQQLETLILTANPIESWQGIHEFSNLELLDVRGTGLKPKNLESPRSVHVDY